MVQNLESPGLSRRVDSTGYIRGGGLGGGGGHLGIFWVGMCGPGH